MANSPLFAILREISPQTLRPDRRFRCWRALLEQAAGAEGIVVAGAATPPHEPSETEFEGHAAFLASAESVRGSRRRRPRSQDVGVAPTTIGTGQLVECRPSSIGMDVADEQDGLGGPGDRREAVAIAALQRAADLLRFRASY